MLMNVAIFPAAAVTATASCVASEHSVQLLSLLLILVIDCIYSGVLKCCALPRLILLACCMQICAKDHSLAKVNAPSEMLEALPLLEGQPCSKLFAWPMHACDLQGLQNTRIHTDLQMPLPAWMQN